MTSEYISTDCWNSWSYWSNVVVVQSQVPPSDTGGVSCTHVPRWASAIGNGAGTVVPPDVVVLARPLNEAPQVSPFQRNVPSVVRGPATILATTAASCAVICPHGVVVPTSVAGSNRQRSGSPITPSATPSPAMSHAAIAAVWNAASLH